MLTDDHEISLDIADAYVVVWPRNMNEIATVDLDIRPNPAVTIEMTMTDVEATALRDALTTAIERSRIRAAQWKQRQTK